MRIGLLHQTDRIDGGVYQYSLSVIEALARNNDGDQYVVVTSDGATSDLSVGGEVVSPPQEGFLSGRLMRKLYNGSLKALPIPLPLLIPFRFTTLGRWNRRGDATENLRLDLLICPFPTLAARQMGLPYIMVIHDIMHKYYPADHPWKEKAYRDVVFKRGAEGSIFTVVDSEQGKMDLHRFYKMPLDRIKVVPFPPPPYLSEHKDLTASEVDSTLRRFDLPQRFIFYPAHFWRHKNHARLVKGLHRIRREHGVEVPAVFVGAPKESFGEVMSLIKKLGLSRQILHLGYVSDEEIVALYKRAVALVMPTLYGPTNIPIVEALVLGSCCLCSDLFSMPEQVGNAGLVFDPFDERDIAEKVWRIWEDDDLRLDLIDKGRLLAGKRYTPEVFAQRWREIVSQATEICGGNMPQLCGMKG